MAATASCTTFVQKTQPPASPRPATRGPPNALLLPGSLTPAEVHSRSSLCAQNHRRPMRRVSTTTWTIACTTHGPAARTALHRRHAAKQTTTAPAIPPLFSFPFAWGTTPASEPSGRGGARLWLGHQTILGAYQGAAISRTADRYREVHLAVPHSVPWPHHGRVVFGCHVKCHFSARDGVDSCCSPGSSLRSPADDRCEMG
jgi:hypothetical protein